jgi:glycosyltransferase involved in cell wall biosynthesis
MRVGLIWAGRSRLIDISVRYERFARGLRRLGHEPVTVCLPTAADGYSEPVLLAPAEAALRGPAFWRTARLDAALAITWLGLPDLVGALKQSCPWVVSIADSDGRIGARAHPGPTWRRAVAQHTSWGMKLRAAGYWVRLSLGGPEEQDRPILASAEQADRIAVGSPVAADHLRAFFDSYSRPELASKVVAVPYPIDDCYLTGPVPTTRPERVIAIGRWDDPQKDAGLLGRALERYFAAGGRAEAVLFGPNGERWFGPLARRRPQVHYLGAQPPEVVAEHLRTSRALLLSSRWESGPLVLNEALASGCSVVGTDAVPSVVSACAEGGFGTVSCGRSAARLATALAAELVAWERGERDPSVIASHWRPRFDPVSVCRQFLPMGC